MTADDRRAGLPTVGSMQPHLTPAARAVVAAGAAGAVALARAAADLPTALGASHGSLRAVAGSPKAA